MSVMHANLKMYWMIINVKTIKGQFVHQMEFVIKEDVFVFQDIKVINYNKYNYLGNNYLHLFGNLELDFILSSHSSIFLKIYLYFCK
jgi:hypothetical protein